MPIDCYTEVSAKGKLKNSFLKTVSPNPSKYLSYLEPVSHPNIPTTDVIYKPLQIYPFLHVTLLKFYLQEVVEQKLLQKAYCWVKTEFWHLSQAEVP